MSHEPLVVGAALKVPELGPHIEWLRERDRDLELQDFCELGVLDGDWQPLASEARRRLDGWRGRLGIHGPFRGFTLDCPDPELRAVARKRLVQALDVCEALGADLMVVHSPITTWDDFNRRDWPDAEAERVAAVRALLAPVLARAADAGVTLAIENIEDRDPAARVALAGALGSPALKVSVDTGHAHYAHVATGGPPVDHYVSAAGAALAHVHLQDSDGWADRHWPPGEGTISWEAVFRELALLDERPRLVLELRNPDWVQRGARSLVARGVAL